MLFIVPSSTPYHNLVATNRTHPGFFVDQPFVGSIFIPSSVPKRCSTAAIQSIPPLCTNFGGDSRIMSHSGRALVALIHKAMNATHSPERDRSLLEFGRTCQNYTDSNFTGAVVSHILRTRSRGFMPLQFLIQCIETSPQPQLQAAAAYIMAYVCHDAANEQTLAALNSERVVPFLLQMHQKHIASEHPNVVLSICSWALACVAAAALQGEAANARIVRQALRANSIASLVPRLRQPDIIPEEMLFIAINLGILSQIPEGPMQIMGMSGLELLSAWIIRQVYQPDTFTQMDFPLRYVHDVRVHALHQAIQTMGLIIHADPTTRNLDDARTWIVKNNELMAALLVAVEGSYPSPPTPHGKSKSTDSVSEQGETATQPILSTPQSMQHRSKSIFLPLDTEGRTAYKFARYPHQLGLHASVSLLLANCFQTASCVEIVHAHHSQFFVHLAALISLPDCHPLQVYGALALANLASSRTVFELVAQDAQLLDAAIDAFLRPNPTASPTEDRYFLLLLHNLLQHSPMNLLRGAACGVASRLAHKHLQSSDNETFQMASTLLTRMCASPVLVAILVGSECRMPLTEEDVEAMALAGLWCAVKNLEIHVPRLVTISTKAILSGQRSQLRSGPSCVLATDASESEVGYRRCPHCVRTRSASGATEGSQWGAKRHKRMASATTADEAMRAAVTSAGPLSSTSTGNAL